MDTHELNLTIIDIDETTELAQFIEDRTPPGLRVTLAELLTLATTKRPRRRKAKA